MLKVDGGATVNDTLMQLQADVLGVPVVRPVVAETTALGAAYAAGLAVGFWKDLDDLRQNWRMDKRWEPRWSADQRDAATPGGRRRSSGRSTGPDDRHHRSARIASSRKRAPGGMGIVYRAVDVQLKRPVALKVLNAAALADPDRKRRFVQEAQAASALNHPDIVTIYQIGSRRPDRLHRDGVRRRAIARSGRRRPAAAARRRREVRARTSPARSPRRITPASSIAI